MRRRRQSAQVLVSPGQAALGFALVAIALLETVVFGPMALLRTIVALITAFYAVFVGMKLLVWIAGTRAGTSALSRLSMLADDLLPVYTVLVPMHKESKATIEHLVGALTRLVYPVSKLQILLLMEEDDAGTQGAVASIQLPGHFVPLLIPVAGPQTKPKACDFGYMHARDELENAGIPLADARLVIFDAEDRPHRMQLRMAATWFAHLLGNAKTKMVGCLQARLVFWNPRVSAVSAFYWGEYGVHFDIVLRGMAKLGLIPPLGGTSNHFTMESLEAVAQANGLWQFHDANGNLYEVWGPWDPFNLTEDADLAARLYEAGYRIEMLGSVTYEEAPTGFRAAKNQRSRWLQGYWQTFMVHTRQAVSKIRKVGFIRWFSFNLFMFGTPFSIAVNPITWVTTALYVFSRLGNHPAVATFIEALFPGPVYYTGMLVAVFGNAMLFYQKLLVPLRRQEEAERAQAAGQEPLEAHLREQEYGLTLRLLLTPLWWAFTSASAYRALRKLLTPGQRHAWDKTDHGHAAHTEAHINNQHATPNNP